MYTLFIFLVFFLITPTSYSAEFKYSDIEKSVFRVQTPIKYGTGFYIGKGLFVTNAHVVFTSDIATLYMSFNESSYKKLLEESPDLKKEISKNVKIQFKESYLPVESILALDIANDLAVLKVSESNISVVEEEYKELNLLAPLELSSLTEVKNKKGYMYGYPVLRPYFNIKRINLKEVILKNMSSSKPESIDAFANENHLNGASGSPILVDGLVVGVAKNSMHNSLSATSSDALKTLLENPLPKPLTKMHEITRAYISLRNQTKKDWKVLVALQLLEVAFANDSEYEERYILKNTKNLENILKHYPNIASAEQLQDYYYVMKKYKEILDLGEKFPYPTLLHRNGIIHLKLGNLDKAVESFQKSAKQNYNLSLYVLALYYLVKDDLLKYEKYLKRAALRGHFLAQQLLDEHYEYENKEGYSGKRFSKYKKNKPLLSLETDIYVEPAFFIDRFEELLKEQESESKGSCQKTFKQ